MLSDLANQESSPALARRLRRYTSPAILCIDEVGYLSYSNRYADLLFQVVTRRYEARKSILLSTNKAFNDWSEVFPHDSRKPKSDRRSALAFARNVGPPPRLHRFYALFDDRLTLSVERRRAPWEATIVFASLSEAAATG